MFRGLKKAGYLTISILFISLLTFQIVNADEDHIQDTNPSDTFNTIELKLGDYNEKGAVNNAELVFLRNDVLSIKEAEGTFIEYLVSNNEIVEKGQALLSYRIPYDHIGVEEKKLSLVQNQKSYEEDLRNREAEIAAQRSLLQSMEQKSIEAQTLRLKITKLEIDYERFKYQSRKSIDNLKKTIADMEAASQIQYIYAPYDGWVFTDDRIKEDQPINSRMELIRIYDINSAVLAAPAAGANKIWYNQEVSITRISNRQENRSSVYKGKVIAADSVLDNKASTGMIYIALEDRELYSTISKANVSADSVMVKNVFVIPLKAVKFFNEERYINYLDEAGVIHKQYITGRDNGVEMWVYNGLSEGQKIIVD